MMEEEEEAARRETNFSRRPSNSRSSPPPFCWSPSPLLFCGEGPPDAHSRQQTSLESLGEKFAEFAKILIGNHSALDFPGESLTSRHLCGGPPSRTRPSSAVRDSSDNFFGPQVAPTNRRRRHRWHTPPNQHPGADLKGERTRNKATVALHTKRGVTSNQ